MLDYLNIQIVKGGFIVEYDNSISQSVLSPGTTREVHVSQRKLLNRIKELIEQASLVPPETE